MTASTSAEAGRAARAPRRGTAFWRFAYLAGLTPWERAGAAGAAGLDRLVAREELAAPPHGRLLDVGCGTGMHAVRLARRGWDVTGVDVVPRAIARAEQRGAAAGVTAAWVTGDVRQLEQLVEPSFRLVLDVGCFTVLDDERRDDLARAVDTLAEPGAALVMLTFPPKGSRRPGPRGASNEDVLDRMPGWVLADERADDVAAPRALGGAGPRWLTLRKVGPAG